MRNDPHSVTASNSWFRIVTPASISTTAYMSVAAKKSKPSGKSRLDEKGPKRHERLRRHFCSPICPFRFVCPLKPLCRLTNLAFNGLIFVGDETRSVHLGF